jgi:hypothetical protein
MENIDHLSTHSIICGLWFSLNSHINVIYILISYPHYPLLQQSPTPWPSSASSVASSVLSLFIHRSIMSLSPELSASIITSTSSSPCALHNQFQFAAVSSVVAQLHHRHHLQSINICLVLLSSCPLVLLSSLSPTQPSTSFYHQSCNWPLLCRLSVGIVSIKPQSHDF